MTEHPEGSQFSGFGSRRFLWHFDWVDDLYVNWGSPTCPLEPHSHRLSYSSDRRLPRHWVNYPVEMQRSFNEGARQRMGLDPS